MSETARTQTIDCLVLCRDKVIRAMLATCARSVGLQVHAAGSARQAVEALGRRGLRYELVLVGPQVEDAEAGKVAQGLAASGKVGRVLGFGIAAAPEGATFEARSFPVDFSELFRELRGSAPEAPAQAA